MNGTSSSPVRQFAATEPGAMRRSNDLKDQYEVAFACDTDHDRHRIVARSAGFLPPNHYLSAALYYLFQHWPKGQKAAAVGNTSVSGQMIDCVTTNVERKLYEAPVGLKSFVDGLLNGSLDFSGEESAGVPFGRLDGSIWTTDKDGMIPALLTAEITSRMGRDQANLISKLSLRAPALDVGE